MTSMAFGVIPLVIAGGAGSASHRDGGMEGMILATVLAVFFVSVFLAVVRQRFKGSGRQRRLDAAHLTPQHEG